MQLRQPVIENNRVVDCEYIRQTGELPRIAPIIFNSSLGKICNAKTLCPYPCPLNFDLDDPAEFYRIKKQQFGI